MQPYSLAPTPASNSRGNRCIATAPHNTPLSLILWRLWQYEMHSLALICAESNLHCSNCSLTN